APLTGNPLARDYVYSFFTSVAGAARAPEIVSIEPNTGSIEGGTEVVIRGRHFGEQPTVFVGGQPVVVDEVLPADGADSLERIRCTTLPHYAGPAAVQVSNPLGLSATVIGGFTYVDLLQISFVTPAVIRVQQAGENDAVEIVGYGFHDGLSLKAYPSGQIEQAVTQKVGSGSLKLYSSERLRWIVPALGNGYRGFVDLELSDASGRRAILPRALFMGRLGVNRRLENKAPFSQKQLEEELKRVENGLPATIVPDPLKLPPGKIVGLASDAALNLVYVLGAGTPVSDGPRPSDILHEDQLRHFVTPGWISLVHYNRDAIGDAAPMHGLGYYDLPQDLMPTALALAEQQLYVTAKGYDFPRLDTTYEGQVWLLV